MAARWTSRHASPAVVGAYQVGSNRNVGAVNCWMTYTARKIAHKMGLIKYQVCQF